MFYIQGDEGWYFMGWLRASPIWTSDVEDAKTYNTIEDAAPDEQKLEIHGSPCWIIPA